jgi:hypothetical protein
MGGVQLAFRHSKYGKPGPTYVMAITKSGIGDPAGAINARLDG